MKNLLSALALVALVFASAPASSKTRTIRIEISGAPLATPLEITEATILSSFSIWNGPSVRVNGKPIHMEPGNQERIRAFIDWPRGTVSSRATGLQRFQVTFHQGGREGMHEWHRRYVVIYEYDPSAQGGYIYLPGRDDGEDYKRNVFSIGHGVEGNWFHSSPAWERLVRPLIDKAAGVAPAQI
jgi:hypothetical protein